MKTLALTISTLFAVTFSTIYAAETVETEITGQGARFVRTVNADGTTSLAFTWDNGAPDQLVSEIQNLDPDAEELEDISVSFQTLLPTWPGQKYRVVEFETQRGEIPLPDKVGDFLDKRFGCSGEAAMQVREGQRIIFREMTATVVEVTPFKKVEDAWYPLINISLGVEKVSVPGELRPAGLSPSFVEAYRMFFSEDELDEIGVLTVSGGYLVVTHEIYLGSIDPWIQWKRQCGYPVHVLEVPNNPEFLEVRNLIANAYATAETKPEFVLLVGDPTAGNNYHMPGDYIESGHTGIIITDHSYTLLEGEDIWPEMWIGRFSQYTLQDALKASLKTVFYEMGTGLDEDPNWVNRGLVISDNTYSSTGLTSSWIRGQMIDYGFSEVDSVFYPPHMTSGPVISAINEGLGWVNYRGFGSPSGWIFPIVSTFDILDLNNESQLPIITSIVCGGGMFDSVTDPCLGEAFLRAGTVNSLRGGVAFVGPSELDTHTRWNNCLNMNLYQGILNEGITAFGPAVFRGKMGVWNGFPNNHEPGLEDESAWFYFFAYNILGDPGLLMRTALPVQLELEVQDTLALESNDLPVLVTDTDNTPQEGIRVTLNDDTWGPVSLLTGPDGMVRFDLSENLPQETDLLVTAVAFNTIPAIDTVQVRSMEIAVALDSLVLDLPPVPGAEVSLVPYLRNSGTADQEFSTAELAAVEEGITLVDNTAEYNETVQVGQQASPLSYSLEIPVNVIDGFDPGLILTVQAGESEVTIRLPFIIKAPLLLQESRAVAVDEPGLETSFAPMFRNKGSIVSDEVAITMESDHLDLEILAGETQMGPVQAGEVSPTETELSVQSNDLAYPGVPLPVNWTATAASGRVENGAFMLVPGVAEVDDPHGPDKHGYMVFDNIDEEYWNRPAWEWFEIDPVFGGQGTVLDLPDFVNEADVSVALDLPFTFTFYGNEYDVITVCSNGWLCMGDTGEIYFRNWNLPEGPGPMNLIAPFWDDLVMGDGRVAWYYDQPRGRLIVQWSRVKLLHQENQNLESSFQAVLYSSESRPTPTGDGEIEFIYLEIHDVDSEQNYSTIGIRNGDGTDGFQLLYATHRPETVAVLEDERAYRFTTSRRPGGPAVRITAIEALDDGSGGSDGNGDGLVQNNEVIVLLCSARNFGQENAQGVILTLESEDPFINIEQAEVNLGDIEMQETVEFEDGPRFSVDFNTPDRHFIPLHFQFADDNGNSWSESRSFDVYAPLIRENGFTITDDEPGGNGNGFAESGETVELFVVLENWGRNGAGDIEITIISDGQYAEILEDSAVLDTLGPGEEAATQEPFVIQISEECPEHHRLELPLAFTVNGNDLTGDTLGFRLGIFLFNESFEDPDLANWFLIMPQWHNSYVESFSPAHSLRWGNMDGDSYDPNHYDRAMTDFFTLLPNSWIDFQYMCDLGTGDDVTLKIRTLDQEVICQVVMAGFHPVWQLETHQINLFDGAEQVMIDMVGRSNHFIEGTGFYIDDIAIYQSEVGVEEENQVDLPEHYSLDGPYPNPFNSTATVTVSLPEPGPVTLRVYDILGREVITLIHENLPAGNHKRILEAENLSSGIYFIRFEAGSVKTISKAVLLR